MVFEFPGLGNFIHVTAEYSNAVLVALLPYVSDYAQRLDLPVPHPITAADVVGSNIMPWLDKDGGIGGAGIGVKGGYGFTFSFGLISLYGGPRSFEGGVQGRDDIPKFYGEVKMSKSEAVQMARDTLKKLGIALELVYAEQEPTVGGPSTIDGHTIPYLGVHWNGIWPASSSVDIEIDADRKHVERVYIANLNLHGASPKAALVPPFDSPPPRRMNPEYARRLVPLVLRAVDDYGQRLSLPLPRPLSSNQVERLVLWDEGGRPRAWLKLTNGWWFLHRNSHTINGFYAPGNLAELPAVHSRVLIKDVLGHWNLNQTQAVQLVARTLAKLNYPTNVARIDFEPRVGKPAIPGIPRYQIDWLHTPPSHHSETEGDVDFAPDSIITAEVDADKGELKSLCHYVNDGDDAPALGVPISLQVERSPDQAPVASSGKPSLKKPPSRPQSVFNTPLPR